MEGIFYERPHNRRLLSNGMIPAIEEAVEREASKNPQFHSFGHSQEIVKVALEIATSFGADMEICYAAALMRDVKRRSSPRGHEYRSARAAKSLLGGLGLPVSFAENVGDAISCSHKVSAQERAFPSPEARVVWEASKIFNLGAFGFESRLLPICNACSAKDLSGSNAAYTDAARIYLALEGRFRTPMFVDAIRESSENMHEAFRNAGIRVPEKSPQ
jgi:HD superfamily phosphodiesterase